MSKADSIKCECDCDRTLFWPKRARATHAFANCLNLSLDSKLTRLSFFSCVKKHLLQSHFQLQKMIVPSSAAVLFASLLTFLENVAN
jgi:hypothetical protein